MTAWIRCYLLTALAESALDGAFNSLDETGVVWDADTWRHAQALYRAASAEAWS